MSRAGGGALRRGSRIIGDTNQPGIWEINIVRSTRSLSRSKHPSLAARRSPLRRAARRLLTEPLEDRRVLATWVPMGPAPIINGQVENIAPDNQVIGAAQAVVAHPSDANTVYIGAVNGGVWKTTNATSTNPTWTPLTDDLASLSIGDLEMDPTDPQTLLGGIGRASAFSQAGGNLTGVIVTRDGGDTWTEIADPLLVDNVFSAVYVRGDLMMAASNGGFKDFLDFGSLFGEKTGGLFRSTDGGASWTSIEILERDPEEPDTPVEFNAYDLVGDPTNPNRFYISLQDVGIFRSDDAGLTWTNVSRNDATLDQAIRFPIGANIEIPGINTNTEMSVASNGRIFVGTVEFGQVEYIGYSDDLGSSWEQMDLPFTPDGPNGESVGLQPRQKAGAQGSIHFSILADPNDPNTVYVGGDRQETDSGNPLGNSIGARDFSGRLFRGDTTQERFDPLALPIQIVSPQWEHLTHDDNVFFDVDGGTASSSAPHADSRGMTFDASGNLLEVDDGGIYRRTSPKDNTGDWFSMIGNLQVTEMHDVAYDSNSNIIIAGTQDVGTVMQLSPPAPRPGNTSICKVTSSD